MMNQLQKQFRVLLIGDNCVDQYCYGTVDRISPEAPVPIFNEKRRYSLPGMAGNVAENLLKLGLQVECIFGNQISSKVRYIDERHNHHIIRIDNDVISDAIVVPVDISKFDAIVVSDYDKGSIDNEVLHNIILNTSIPIFIDSKKTELSDFGSDIVFYKINEKESIQLKTSPRNVIITLGENGAMYNGTKYSQVNISEVSDVCGAGDTFLAALSYSYLHNNDIGKSIEFANIAAGITVKHIGVYAPTLKEIYEA